MVLVKLHTTNRNRDLFLGNASLWTFLACQCITAITLSRSLRSLKLSLPVSSCFTFNITLNSHTLWLQVWLAWGYYKWFYMLTNLNTKTKQQFFWGGGGLRTFSDTHIVSIGFTKSRVWNTQVKHLGDGGMKYLQHLIISGDPNQVETENEREEKREGTRW